MSTKEFRNTLMEVYALVIGELLWDVFPDEHVLGGAPANVSACLSRLGAQVYLCTALGDDEFGKQAKLLCQEKGILSDLVQVHGDYPTGTVQVDISDPENPDYEIGKDVAYDYINYDEDYIDVYRKASVVYIGSLVQRSVVSRNTIKKILKENIDALVFCDVNLRKECYSAEILEYSLQASDVIKLNEEEVTEVAALCGLSHASPSVFMSELLKKFNVTSCIITKGEHGYCGMHNTEGECMGKAESVNIVDTVGAGDAFSAGFMYMFLQGGMSFKECCEFANKQAALACARKGGM